MRGRNVLHVVTDTDRRGAQIFASDLCGELAALGCPGRVVALRPGSQGATLDVPVLGSGPSDPRALRALRSEMSRAQVVVAHGSNTLRACSVAGLGLGVPVVYRNISDPAFWTSTGLRRLRVRALLRHVDHVVSLFAGGADYLSDRLGVGPGKVTTIPNAVRGEDFRPPTPAERTASRSRFGLPQEATVLLFVAALQPEKHPVEAVESLAFLPANTRLLMVGEGMCRDHVVARASRVAPGRVVVAGRIDDMASAYWASDVAVLPSEGEGLPAALIEAGLCGVPAVASDSGGNADIVIDGSTGRVVPPADPRALAAGVGDALANREAWGENARRHCVDLFDLGTVARQWRDVLTRVTISADATR